MRRPGLILSLILSILALVYIILDYQGVIRCWKLRSYSIESYLNEYSKIPKSKERVVVVFSASEAEMAKLKPFINSLLDQSVRVHDIVLVTPYKNMKNVPENIKKNFSVRGYSKDYKDAGKLVCSVLTEPDANTRVILVEPSQVYGVDFVESMINASVENPDKVIYARGDRSTKGGILFKPGFFDEKVSEYDDASDCCTWLEKCCTSKSFILNYAG